MATRKTAETSTAKKTTRTKSAFGRPAFTKPVFSAAPKKAAATPSKTLTPAALAKKLAAVEAAKNRASAVVAKKRAPTAKAMAVTAETHEASSSGTDHADMAGVAVEQAREVAFTYSAESPEPRKVFVAGDFNDWNPQAHPLQLFDGGTYRAVLRLAPGTYQYKFVVDGEWTPDPRAELHADNDHGTLNSVVRV